MATAFDTRELSSTWIDTMNRRRQLVLVVLAVGLSLAFARMVLAVDFTAAVGLFICCALIAVGLRPRYGLYLLLVNTLLFDGVNLDPLMMPGWYINTSLQTTLKVTGAILIPFEMVLLLTSAIWLA